MVGPDYTQPNSTGPDYSDVLQPESEDVLSGQGEITPGILAEWWDTLDDPILTELIHRALAGSPDLDEVKASVREARALLGISGARLLPFLDAGTTYERSDSSENVTMDMGEDNLYRVGFDAGWELDVFGGTRKEVEAAQANRGLPRTEGLTHIARDKPGRWNSGLDFRLRAIPRFDLTEFSAEVKNVIEVFQAVFLSLLYFTHFDQLEHDVAEIARCVDSPFLEDRQRERSEFLFREFADPGQEFSACHVTRLVEMPLRILEGFENEAVSVGMVFGFLCWKPL